MEPVRDRKEGPAGILKRGLLPGENGMDGSGLVSCLSRRMDVLIDSLRFSSRGHTYLRILFQEGSATKESFRERLCLRK
jgi:hypothetical protein